MRRGFSDGARCALLVVGCLLAFGGSGVLGDPTGADGRDLDLSPAREMLDDCRFGEAEGWLRQTVAVLDARPDADSIALADALDLLTLVLWQSGKSNEQETLDIARRAVEVRERAAGSTPVERVPGLHNLAIVHAERFDLDQAARLLQESLAIQQRRLPEDDPEIGRTLHRLANVLYMQVDLGAARQTYRDALAIRSAVVTRNPDDAEARSDLATTLDMLGGAEKLLGDFDSAHELHEQAYRIRLATEGEHSIATAHSLSNIAEQDCRLGRIERCAELLAKALALDLEFFGSDHPDTAHDTNSLASARHAMGHYDEAQELYARALEIRLRLFDTEDAPQVAVSLTDLAGLAVERGRLEEAESLLLRAASSWERLLGDDHPVSEVTLARLAAVRWMSGNPADALARSLQAERVSRERFREIVRDLTEDEALAYGSQRVTGLDVALTVVASQNGKDDQHAGRTAEAWAAVAHSRGMVLDEVSRRTALARALRDEELRGVAASLQRVGGRLARMLIRGPGEQEWGQYEKEVHALRDERDRLEAVLAQRNDGFPTSDRGDRVTAGGRVEPNLSELPEDAALVAFARYDRLVRHDESTTGSRRRFLTSAPSDALHLEPRATPSYIAFVKAGPGAPPIAIDLGDAAPIDDLVDAWRRSLASPPRTLAAMLTSQRADASHGVELRRAIWEPLEPYLGSARMVLLIPDGSLNLIRLDLLPARDGGFLIESIPPVHYLTAERELSRRQRSEGHGTLIMGGPGVDPQTVEPAEWASVRSGARECSNGRRIRLTPLAGAAEETREIANLWRQSSLDVVEFVGSEASEAAFKRSAPGKRVVHVATHGISIAAECNDPSDRGVRSGLVFAESVSDDDGVAGSPEDGILYPEEIAALDLSSVDWLVLSSCESGLGEVALHEGVIGLRRAFIAAGARTLITSLWRVDDAATREFMRTLHQKRIEGATTAVALQSATLDVLRARRRDGRSTHPFFWGGFVATGDWR